MTLTIQPYEPRYAEKWDKFILEKSRNGTFLQTRRFIEYHPADRFEDASFLVYKGEEIVAACLACRRMDENGRSCLVSHPGTTHGGLVVSDAIYSANRVDALFQVVENHCKQQGYASLLFKQPGEVYCAKDTQLLDYFFFKEGFSEYKELNYYMPLAPYTEDILACFSGTKRRALRSTLKNGLHFTELRTAEEIDEFYELLLLTLHKLGASAVHSRADLEDLRCTRFPQRIHFYGVYHEEKMVAGGMTFQFDHGVLHTQYLCSDPQALALRPMDFLVYHLIKQALQQNNRMFSFGICTENRGKELNYGLSSFKEEFGAGFGINHSYYKELQD